MTSIIQELTKRALAGDSAALKELRDRGVLPQSDPSEAEVIHPASHAQKRLWFHCQFEDAKVAYNMPASFLLKGDIDTHALSKAFSELIRRHESLRTTFIMKEGELFQVIRQKSDFQIDFKDLTSEPDPETAAKTFALGDILKPFDFEKGPLLRLSVLKIPEGHIMVFNMHHIISDGWSIRVFLNDLSRLYSAFANGRDNPLMPLRIQYKDFTVWQFKQLENPEIQTHLEYWRKKLAGEIPILDIPSDFPRPAVQAFAGDTEVVEFTEEMTRALKSFSVKHGVSLFMMLCAVVKVLLYRYTNQTDVIVGSPAAGREHMDLEDQVGFYVNTLALRDELDGEKDFVNVLKQVRATVEDAFEHQVYPFDKLVEDLKVRRDLSRSPLFDVVVVLHTDELAFSFDGVAVEPFVREFPVSKYDMTFHFFLEGSVLKLGVEYRTDLFLQSRIQRMETHLETLFNSILKEPKQPISVLNILPDAEKNRLLGELNDTKAGYPEKTIVELFEEQVERTPDHTAVIFGDTGWTYRELNEHANRLANYLRDDLNVAPDERVAVILGRTELTVSTLLAILKSGGAYVPIDATYPEDRIQYILDDSGTRMILSEAPYLEIARKFQARGEMTRRVVDIRNFGEKASSQPEKVGTPDHTAYVIYTSGSTGMPKGCLVTHRNVVRLMINDKFTYRFGPRDVWVVAHSFCFDFSVWEMYGALLYGGSVVIATAEETRDPNALLALVKRRRVTVLNQTPAAFYNFIEAESAQSEHRLDDHLRYVIFGGDKLNPAYLRPWVERYPLDGIRVVNMYGITETTVHVSFGPLTEKDVFFGQGKSPIGVPLPETRVYVLDENMAMMPMGIPGEFYVGGSGVCNGYLNREELTAEKFLPDPFFPGETMYRTGDVGRWMDDGNLEFFGRNDDQVQVRGFRVELGEIEVRLAEHELVEKAVVTARDDDRGVKILSAYIVCPEDRKSDFNINILKDHLRKTLPEYMLPSHYTRLDRFPLTSNNKVDRKALPSFEGVRPELEQDFIAPETETEKQVAHIWKTILNIDAVGAHDNFFDLGGHSLLLVKLRNALNDTLDQNLTMVEMFKYPTVRSLAKYLHKTEDSGPPEDPGKNRAQKRLEASAHRRKTRRQHPK